MSFMSFAFQVVVVLCVAFYAAAEYEKVIGESCPQLQTPTTLFDLLLPCASYQSEPVDLICLTSQQTDKYAKTVPDWTLVKNNVTGDSLRRSFVFEDFQQAFYFMSQTAQLAERNQHHPDWHNLWNTVDVVLTTDDKACLSTFDIELAQGMDLIASKLKLRNPKL